MTAISWEFSPKQIAFIKATQRYLCYSGCYRGGKTVALCARLVMRASRRGAVEGLGRKTLKSLKATTLRVLLDGYAGLPPMLPMGSYEHKPSEFYIQLRDGGRIEYFGIEDPENIQGYTWTGCAIDEATQLTEQDWTTIDGRVSTHLADDFPMQVYAACNPAGPGHILAQRFGFVGMHPRDGAVIRGDYWGQLTAAYENPFLHPDVLRSLGNLRGVPRKRYYEGLWVGNEGLVYDDWDRDVHVQGREPDWEDVVLCIDDGGRDNFAVLRLGIDTEGAVHAEREYVGLASSTAKKLRLVSELGAGATAVIYDSAAKGLGNDLRDAEIRGVVRANKGVQEGITRVKDYLSSGRFTVDPSCKELIKEFESYEWDKSDNKDVPKKVNDHALDALRYGLMYLAAPTGVYVGCADGSPPPEEERHEETAKEFFERKRQDPLWGFRPANGRNAY